MKIPPPPDQCRADADRRWGILILCTLYVCRSIASRVNELHEHGYKPPDTPSHVDWHWERDGMGWMSDDGLISPEPHLIPSHLRTPYGVQYSMYWDTYIAHPGITTMYHYVPFIPCASPDFETSDRQKGSPRSSHPRPARPWNSHCGRCQSRLGQVVVVACSSIPGEWVNLNYLVPLGVGGGWRSLGMSLSPSRFASFWDADIP